MTKTQNYTIFNHRIELSEKEKAEAIKLATYGIVLSRQIIFYAQSEAQRKRGYAMTEAYGHLLSMCGADTKETVMRLRKNGLIGEPGQSARFLPSSEEPNYNGEGT